MYLLTWKVDSIYCRTITFIRSIVTLSDTIAWPGANLTTTTKNSVITKTVVAATLFISAIITIKNSIAIIRVGALGAKST